jgi:hypothetical protein
VPQAGDQLRLIDNGLGLPEAESRSHFANSDLLRKAVGEKVPDLSAWAGKRAAVQAALEAHDLEPAAVSAAMRRFDALVGAAGRTFGDLPYAGHTVAEGMKIQGQGMRQIRAHQKGNA